MKAADVPAQELEESKSRVAGSLLMNMQTVSDQAFYRVAVVLNHYPLDYYDRYADRIGQVTAEDVRKLVNKYVDENRMTVVVVGPAETLKGQLEKLGAVEVVKPE
jgi:zinc protease